MEAALQRVVDEAAIKDVHLRYCRGIDRMDWDLVRSAYHPEAVDDHGPFKGSVEEFIDWVSALLTKGFQTWTHFAGQQMVRIEGDRALMESYARAYHRTRPDADGKVADWILNLRYVDVLERREGDWRIIDRVLSCDSEITIPVDPEYPAVLGPDWHRGSADTSDLSYTRAEALVH